MAGIKNSPHGKVLKKLGHWIRAGGTAVTGITPLLVLAAMVVTALSVLPSSVSKSDEKLPSEIIAVFPKNFPPYYVTDEQGNSGGFAIEVFDEVAKRAGLTIRYEAQESWNETFAAMKSGQAHVIPNLGITDKRKKYATFTVPIDSHRISMFTRREVSEIKALKDLANHTVGVVRLNLGAKLISQWKNVKVKVFNDYPEALEALIANEIDALIYPETIIWNLARSRGVDGKIKTVGRPLREVSRAIAVRKDLIDLHQALDTALWTFLNSPDFERIYRKWHGAPQDTRPATINWQLLTASTAISIVILIALVVGMRIRTTLKSSARSSPIRIDEHGGRKRILALIVVMASITISATVITMAVLYNAALKEKERDLIQAARSHARLIESIARFNQEQSANYPNGATPATLSQLKEGLSPLTGSNELTLAQRVGDDIVFLLRQKASRRYEPAPIPFSSPLAEPMRRALSGRSGLLVGLDYRNKRVLAAHEPIDILDLGIVFKIDMAEIQEPFIWAGVTASVISFLAIIVGAVAFFRVGEPMVRETREIARRFMNIFDSSAVAIWEEDFSFLYEELEQLRNVEIDDLRSYLKRNKDEAWRLSRLVRVNHVNPAALKLYGASSVEDFLGSANKIFLSTPIDVFIEALNAIWEGREYFRSEASQRTLDGRDIVVIISMPIPKDEEMRANVPVSIVDITAEKRATEKLRENESRIQEMNIELESRIKERTAQLEAMNKELEAFTYSVSHDLRAPLRAIDGFSEALLEDYGERLDGEAKQFLQYLREGSQEMALLIDDLLKLSRSTRGEMEKTLVNVSEIVLDMTAKLKKSNPGRNVTIDIAPDVVVLGDKRLLSTALQNLLDNAWKFTSKKPKARIEFGCERRDGRVVCHVRDNGVGFDEKYSDKLFEPFQRLHSQTEFDGTGVGLTTVQRIIARHGGRVWAEAEVGEGACFYFDLEGRDASS